MDSTKARIALIAVVAVGVIGYRALFVDDDEVIRFNEKLITQLDKAITCDEAVGTHLEAYTQGKQVTVPQIKRRRDSCAKSLARTRTAMAKIEVPDCAYCRKFHKACLDFVDNKTKLIEALVPVIAHVEEHNPGTEMDVAAIGAMLGGVANEQERLGAAVATAQVALANEHGLKIEE